MKSLEELKKLREQAQANLELRKQKDGYRVIVGMATCGIAAGARPVLAKFVEEVASRKLDSVTVTQVGCIGECALEPIVEVIDKDGNKVTYVKMDPDKAIRVVTEHIVNGNVVTEYTIGAVQD